MRPALLLLMCLAFPVAGAAQNSRTALPGGQDSRHTFGLWGGVSFASPSWWGAVREREVFLVGLRYQRLMTHTESVTLAYTVDVIPAAAVANTPTRTTRLCCESLPVTVGDDEDTVVEDTERRTAYGFGIAPLGFHLELFRHRPVYLTVGGGGGMLLFDRDVPQVDTHKMNFTATLHVGLRAVVLHHWKVTVGYKFHHLSNAGTGTFNPGLDSSMLYLGWMHR